MRFGATRHGPSAPDACQFGKYDILTTTGDADAVDVEADPIVVEGDVAGACNRDRRPRRAVRGPGDPRPRLRPARRVEHVALPVGVVDLDRGVLPLAAALRDCGHHRRPVGETFDEVGVLHLVDLPRPRLHDGLVVLGGIGRPRLGLVDQLEVGMGAGLRLGVGRQRHVVANAQLLEVPNAGFDVEVAVRQVALRA